ncbi:MAG: type IV toxin-antitoxin system AbiEi family antitoxin domain-containing protein [Micromonosporaceae bacterium]
MKQISEVAQLQAQAASQDGVVTSAECRAAGVALHQVIRLCQAGQWRRVARGTYLVGSDLWGEDSWRTRIRAAVRSLGPGATAVLGSAALLHGIQGVPPARPSTSLFLVAGREPNANENPGSWCTSWCWSLPTS